MFSRGARSVCLALLARGRGRAVGVLAAAVLLAVGLAAPAVASGDTIVVTKSIGSPGVGAPFTVAARALNSTGRTDTSFNGPASWSDNSGHLSPSGPSAFVKGASNTTGAAVSVPYHNDTITVTSGALSGTSTAFNVIGPLNHFSFTKLSTVATNQPFKLVVHALDSAGNVSTDYGGSPTWSDTSKALSPPSPSGPATFVKGVSTNSCTSVGSAQTGDQITVDDTSAHVSSTSPAFNVTAAQVFNSRGIHSFAVACAASITATVIGAHGGTVPLRCDGNEAGGAGASVTGTLSVSAGEELTAGVGGPGGNAPCKPNVEPGSGGTGSGANGGPGGGGGREGGGGGGAASLLSTGTGSPTASSLLLVAGGGGGSTGQEFGGDADSAGQPQGGCPSADLACGGGAGTSVGGGAGGPSDGSPDTPGSNGGFLSGGNGGIGDSSISASGGGGGGGGYNGGGGGGGANIAGGGGGGASFIVSGATNVIGPASTSSPPEVSITYAPPS